MILALMIPMLGAAPSLQSQSWVLDVMVATRTQVPVLGETQVYTRSTLLVDFEQVGDRLVQRQRLCGVQVTDDTRMAETVIPPAFIQAWPEQVFTARFDPSDQGGRYYSDPGPVDIGWDATRSGGVLPTRPQSPGVSDWERDGQPGATVNVVVPVLGQVNLYVAQRGHTVLQGRWDGSSIVGSVTMKSFEQRTLGASHSLFDSSPKTTFVPELSGFRLSPVGEVPSCARLQATWTPGPAPSSSSLL